MFLSISQDNICDINVDNIVISKPAETKNNVKYLIEYLYYLK